MGSHYASGFHQVEGDYEYEDFDNREYDDEEEEEEEEEVEAPKLTVEEQKFLSLREQLKEKFRQKLKKQSASTFGLSSSKHNKMPVANDKFGSFFGPSKPVIARRVIEESNSMRANQHIMPKTHHTMSKASSSSGKSDPSPSNINVNIHQKQPKVINEIKKKAQTLKDMRDYSFLLSEDADLPAPVKESPATKNALAPKSDGRLAQAPREGKIPSGAPARLASNGHGVKKNKPSMNGHVQTKSGPVKEASVNKQRPVSTEARKVPSHGIANGSGKNAANRASAAKIPIKNVTANKPPARVGNDPAMKKSSLSSKPQLNVQNYKQEQKKVAQGPDKVKAAPKQSLPPPKSMPSKLPTNGTRDDYSKRRPVPKQRLDDEEEDGDYAIGMIRKMFGYDPSRYAGMNSDDDSDMEVGFDIIQKEERRSSKIARKEDEEELRLIEEEERRERMRKKQKLLNRR